MPLTVHCQVHYISVLQILRRPSTTEFRVVGRTVRNETQGGGKSFGEEKQLWGKEKKKRDKKRHSLKHINSV